MPADPLVHVERRDDGVAVVRLDNPKVNALSTTLLRAARGGARALTDDPPGAVVVTGGDRIFAAGADISEFGGPDDARRIGAAFLQALNAVADIPRATIAAISGFALGGGCELALACDFRIASDKAQLGQPEILLGIIPGGGGTQRLARLVGPTRAKDLIFTGRQVRADEALRIGLVDEVVAPDDAARPRLRPGGRAGGRRGRGPGPGQAGDRPRPRRHPLSGGLDLEQELFAEVFVTEDAAHRRRLVPRARPRQGDLHGPLSRTACLLESCRGIRGCDPRSRGRIFDELLRPGDQAELDGADEVGVAGDDADREAVAAGVLGPSEPV